MSLTKYVSSTLREAIIAGAIPPGKQLKQDIISAELSVSPAPVREALRQLESEGLVHHIRNRGVFVTDAGRRESVELLLPIRHLIEVYAMRELVGAMTDELTEALQVQIGEMYLAAEAQDFPRINRADVRFHELAIEASGSSRAMQLWSAILPQIRMQFAQLTPRQTDLSYIAGDHEALLKALKQETAPDLDELMDEHIIGTSLRLMSHCEGDEDVSRGGNA